MPPAILCFSLHLALQKKSAPASVAEILPKNWQQCKHLISINSCWLFSTLIFPILPFFDTLCGNLKSKSPNIQASLLARASCNACNAEAQSFSRLRRRLAAENSSWRFFTPLNQERALTKANKAITAARPRNATIKGENSSVISPPQPPAKRF